MRPGPYTSTIIVCLTALCLCVKSGYLQKSNQSGKFRIISTFKKYSEAGLSTIQTHALLTHTHTHITTDSTAGWSRRICFTKSRSTLRPPVATRYSFLHPITVSLLPNTSGGISCTPFIELVLHYWYILNYIIIAWPMANTPCALVCTALWVTITVHFF